jgi:apolipoprotein N-acyltransferase
VKFFAPFLTQLVLALVAGAASVLAFAPFHAWPVALVSLVVLFAQWQRAGSPIRAAAIGFMWSLGLFLTGVSWLYVSLHVYGNMPAVLAGAAVFIFCMYLSTFLAIAAWLQARLRVEANITLLVLMPAAFVLAEVIRAWFVTGFPWLVLGYTQAPSDNNITPLLGYAPIIGVYGITWLLALTAAVIVYLAPKLSGYVVSVTRRRIAIAATISVWVVGVLLMSFDHSSPSGKPLTVSLLQGNVAQHLKFRQDQLQPTIDNYLALVEKSRGKLIVLPETALPLWLNNLPADVTDALAKKAIANDGNLIMGVAYRDNEYAFYNGAVSMGRDPSQRYAKHHLVAFGEFIPPFFSWVYQWLDMPMSGFTPGLETQAPMRLSGHSIAVNICYEDTFGREIARPLPEAELLVNISNMAWYGKSLAADQHAQFSQMRAAETSRWMLRSTNTGVTAAINEKGQIVAALPQFSRGVLEVEAVPRQGITPYVRWKDWPIYLLLVGVLVFAICWRRMSAKIPT